MGKRVAVFSFFRDGCTPETNPGIKFGTFPDHLRCRARAKRTGERCACPAVKGQGVCRHHGAQGLKPSRAKLLRLAARLRGERPENYNSD